MSTTRPSLRDALNEPRFQQRALLAVAALVMLSRLGAGHLANFDDCYYAEKARQMLLTGDWLTPRFSGMTRLDNPPLFLWLIAASFKLFGQSDWAAIFPSALSGVLCVGAVHTLARRLGAEAFEAFAAAVVLLTTSYFLKYSGHAMFDVFLTLLFVLSMLVYRGAWEGRRRREWALLGVLAGLGVLTKSVLGVFPLVVIALHLVWCGRAAWLFTRLPLAALAMLATIAPWYGAQLAVNGELFVREHISWLLWQRGFVIGRETQTAASRAAYFTEIAQVYWPWLPCALAGMWFAGREAFAKYVPHTAPKAPEAPAPAHAQWSSHATARLLLLWPLVVIGIMSLGNEKKLWYVMSAFPALALLAARAIASWMPGGEGARERTVHVTFALLAIAGAVLALTPIGLPKERRPDLQVVAHAARTMVPADSTVMMPDGLYYSAAHQFVYYSRHKLGWPLADSARVRASLDGGAWALFTTSQRERFLGADSLAYPAVVSSGKWSLVHAAPRPEVRLEPTTAFE